MKRALPPLNVIMLGDPGAGKATQAELLVASRHMHDLDMGAILRKVKRVGGSKGKVAAALRATLEVGKLSPTGMVREIFKREVPRVPQGKGILFNGTPKMLGEAKLVLKLLNESGRTKDCVVVVYLSVPKATVIARTWGRGRADDTPAALANRFVYYRKNIAGVVSFFKEHYAFVRVSGVGTVPEVRRRIKEKINAFEAERKN